MTISTPSKPLNWFKIIGAAWLLALLGACSAIKVAYNNGHELAWWWLTDYIDVQGEDRAALRQTVHRMHEWHRRAQLASYVEMLRRWQPLVAGELDPAQVCRMADDVMQRVSALSGAVQVLDPTALQILSRLSAQQIAEMERQFAKGNRKFREKYVDVSSKELLENRLDSGLSRAQWLYGSLGRQQENALRAALAASAWDAREAYAWRLRRQQDIVQTLRELARTQASNETTRLALRALMARNLDMQDSPDRARYESTREQGCQTMARLHASTTPAQRVKAQETLRNYAADLSTLLPSP